LLASVTTLRVSKVCYISKAHGRHIPTNRRRAPEFPIARQTAREVKALSDPSGLVATFYGQHEHHEPSIGITAEKSSTSTVAHCLAEVY
jgi:hypothetical protein